jgi:hypothetical protein
MPSSDPSRFTSQSPLHGHADLDQLPKLHFPKFDGDNPKLWQSKCENYFDMYFVPHSVWVRVATMHFDGVAARWLQSVHHRSWIHDRFGRDQHESLIRQLLTSSNLGRCKSILINLVSW